MIDISLRVAIAKTQSVIPLPEPVRWRFGWDDELAAWNYKCRTQFPGFEGPDNPPAVQRFYPTMAETGDYRVNLEKDPAWDWRGTFIALNAGDVRDWEYLINANTAQFNTTGWPRMAYLGMSGNIVNVLERVGEWFRFETLRATDWSRARGMSIETHPHLIHRFTCVTWKQRADGTWYTHHIESTGTPRGQVYFPLVTWEGYAWAKCIVQA